MRLVMLARVRATLLLLAANKVLDTPNKVQPHPIRPSKNWSFAVSSSRIVSIQPKLTGPGPHFDSDSTGDSDETNMKMPRKVPPPPTIAIKMIESGGGGRRGESESNSPDLFDAPPVGNDKASYYSDEPPTSLSTTAFSKNSQLTPPPLLPCSPPFHLAYYTPANADGRQIPGDSAVEAAYDVIASHGFLAPFDTQSTHASCETHPNTKVHTEFLVNNALDNDSDEYTVIFAPNAPGALKLVGEFTNSTLILSTDSHSLRSVILQNVWIPYGCRSACVIREGFPRQLKPGRRWFAGGTADLAQVPGKVRTMTGVGEEFEGFEHVGPDVPAEVNSGTDNTKEQKSESDSFSAFASKGSSRFGQSENKTPSPFGSQSPPGGAFSNFTSNGPSVFGKPAQTGTSVFGRTKSESLSVFEQPSAGGAFGALKSVSSSVSGAPQAAIRESVPSTHTRNIQPSLLKSAPGSSTIPSSPDSDIVEPSASLRLLGLALLVIPCPTFLRDDMDDEKPAVSPFGSLSSAKPVFSSNLSSASTHPTYGVTSQPGFGFGLKVSTSSSSPTATITSLARTTPFSAFSATSLPFAAVGDTTKSFEQHDHHGDDGDEGNFLSESYDSHLGEDEEQPEEGESEEVFPYLCPDPDPALTLLRQKQPRTEPNSLSPSTSEDSFFGGMTQKLDSGGPQPLFTPFPAASQPALILSALSISIIYYISRSLSFTRHILPDYSSSQYYK
ncbi:hypothetical protein F5877DRAFT_85953 [Lentinula edodes]|nr:hypothetical protein F5877DRAFT_85953 [Lentinula edodes]